jgi:hypothetical protein
MKSLKELFEQIFSRDRRRSNRQPAPELSAFYWTGAAPAQHAIRDISPTGLYLVTEERWYPGTLIMMTLQKANTSEGSHERSIAVQSKAVRWGTDGVGLQFILMDAKDPRRSRNVLNGGVDRKSLERFLQGFTVESGRAVVDGVEVPSRSSDDINISKS